MEGSKINPFQFRSLCGHNGQADMAVDRGPAMTRNMLDHRKDASGKKTFAPGPPEHGGTLCRIAHGAITEDGDGLRVWVGDDAFDLEEV